MPVEFEGLFRRLNDRGVRYVAVGGIAVNAHGYSRLTLDVDLAVDLSPEEALKAVDALTEQGFVPSVPVEARSFADPEARASWIRDKHMQVFPMRDPDDIMRRVDVFVEEPIPFEGLWTRSKVVPYGGTQMRVASIEDLIAMKRLAGRPQDLIDIEMLEMIVESDRDR